MSSLRSVVGCNSVKNRQVYFEIRKKTVFSEKPFIKDSKFGGDKI